MSSEVELASSALRVGVLSYGARISSVEAPDRTGQWAHVAMGFDDPAGWRTDTSYQGASIGRYANRIAGGSFELDGRRYRVPTNDGAAALHGGPAGFDSFDWALGPVVKTTDGGSVTLRRTSPDGEMGFPGKLEVSLEVSLDGPDLQLDYRAETDAPTPVNLTNHVYLNLSGAPSSVEHHQVRFHADQIVAMDADSIPTGELILCVGTDFDFSTATAIGSRWRSPDPQLRHGRGYDHSYVLDGSGPEVDGLRLAARVIEPASGRTLELFTDQPAVQFYTGNQLNGAVVGRGGMLRQGDAFCLEPQHFPDSVNYPHFPSTILRPGQHYRARSRYRFGVS